MADKNTFRGANSIKFIQHFKDNNNCLIYLSNIKWGDVQNVIMM